MDTVVCALDRVRLWAERAFGQSVHKLMASRVEKTRGSKVSERMDSIRSRIAEL